MTSRDGSDALCRWRKEPQAKEYRQPLAAEKGRGTSRRSWPCPHLDFSAGD